MTFSGKPLSMRPTPGPAHYLSEGWLVAPGLIACQFVGRAAIQSAANSWNILDRGGLQPVIPQGARIYRVSMQIPSGLVATNTDLLKVAGAVTDAASADNVLSTAAASATFAAQTALKDTAFPGNTTALAAQTTFRLFSAATGGITAGSNVSAATLRNVFVEICYTIPAAVASSTDFRAVNATANVFYP